MGPLAGRHMSASRLVACSVSSFALVIAVACSSDSPGVVSPTSFGATFDVIDLSAGPVVAEIKSAWQPAQCISVRNGAIADETLADLEPCAATAAQKFEFNSAGEIRVAGSSFCLDASSGHGRRGDVLIIWTCGGYANQKWSQTSAGELKGINGLCVSFRDHPVSGTTMYIDDCRGTADQKWTTEVLSSSTPTTPSPVPVASVSISLSAASLQVGQTAQATATTKDANGNVLTGRTVSFASSSPGIASVTAAGLITALAAGGSDITATSEGKSVSASITVSSVTVTDPTPPASSCSLVTDLNVHPLSAFAKPGYLQTSIEPDFRTPFMRISGDPGTAIGNGVSGSWGNVSRHEYSKKQPWSADGKLFSLDQMGGAVGAGVQLFLDGDTYTPLFARSHPGPEARWHPTIPDVQIYIASNGSVGHWNARTGASTIKVSVSGYSNASMGDYEGNPSYDGRYVVVTATRSDGRLVAFAVDIDGGVKYPDIDLAANGVSQMDWASISALGNYVHVLGVIDGRGQTSKIFTKQGTLVASWPDTPLGHSDLGVDASGNEVIFGAASSGTYSKRFLMRRLDNGQITPLTPATTWDWHSSTRAYQRRGWALAVTNDAAGSTFDREIYWVKLDGSGTMQRLGRHRTAMTDYNASPFAVPSPDGRRVAFASNWGASDGRPVQEFVIDTRSCP